MSAEDPARKATQITESESESAEGQTVSLSGGRTLKVSGAASDLVEIRNPSGMLELRIRLTEEGPVLQMESVKLDLKAAESVSVACKSFEVRAQDKVALRSEGELEVHSEKDMNVTSAEEVRVVGKMIYLN